MARKGIIIIGVALFLWSTITPSFPEEDIEDLKKQIEALQKKVEELESAQSGKIADDPGWFFNRRRPNRQWDPFDEMSRMQEEMNRMFKESFQWGGSFSKGMFGSDMYYDDTFDMREEKDKYIIEFDMAGLNQEKLDIEINEESITIKGEQKREETEEGDHRYYSSKSYSTFLKSVPVPSDADTTMMKSEKKGNKLIITLPKKLI